VEFLEGKMSKIYNKIRISIAIKTVAFCLLLCLLFVCLINLLFLDGSVVLSVDFMFNFIIYSPIVVILYYFCSRVVGYVITDEGVALCRIDLNRKKAEYLTCIKWEDANRIEYKSTYMKLLMSSKITTYSNDDTKVMISDRQCDFQEILDIIQEKAKMHDIPFITK